MTGVQGREPITFDEKLVGFAELQEGCVKKEAVIPPPEDCSFWIDATYSFAKWHLMTGIIIFVFLLMIFQLSVLALKLFKGD
ncbi:MAG: hypothetical protein UU08_C0023G0013 [Candidatus Uhrbacteria bacterium GW2011_GWE2_40_58]|nr:MAG: hypothetical protein UT94_C0020G0012 [Candidatus Uhrbacteria bacterium GW2011_GWF2_40_263]KKR67223.1 MAG: hypothetical protein UU08_C0023G0013 [Candidatus Uhrbacteria bacterium GW2011_GWE2_40_58]OGL92100.1 MAG: hypothetical protein A2239_02840 [Candidatus Uhrbacteria bacterium RIFOXYA2_FULL_40_9]OGL98089.1 MAG: hypothetical protein A2332_03075 [Candidatus Uhrbacteria bacterium RIFOXYB2_FULL_41_18]HBK34874.1 hypothetical protein [Candidatus Uhrbacteria bacterium]